MAVQTTEEFKSAGSTSYTTAIEKLKDTDLKVRIGGALQTYVASSPSSGQYTVTNNPTTIVLGAAAGAEVHIYRETDVNSPAAVFTPGSSIRAVDLNAIHDMGRFAAVEHRNKIITADIKDGQVTSAKIEDGTIVNADINASAAIDNSKIADGLLKSGITVNSANIVNGSIVDEDVSNSANINGSKLLDDSVTLAKLGSGTLPNDIVVTSTNIQNGTIVNDDINTNANIAGSKLANDSVALTKLGGGALPTDITVESANIVNRSIVDEDIHEGTLDNRYYTETELDGGQLDNRYFTESELNGGQLDNRYFTETEITAGAADGRYYTETELDAGQLDNRYFTETELTNTGVLDSRYFTETECDGRFLRQDSTDVIDTNATWTPGNTHVATTGAIEARIIDLIDDVGGFDAIANETSFPTTNPQGTTGQSAILSIAAVSTTLTPSNNVITIANGAGTGNTVTINSVTASSIPQGFGLLVESTSTLHTYKFHRLVPKAMDVNTVATNITNIVAAGANVVDINNFADLYQISNNAPTQRADGSALQDGDLWFDNSNDNLRVYDGTNWAIITPAQSVLDDIAIVSGAITYSEDLGLITDAVSTGSSNGSLDIVADALEDERTFTVTAATGKFIIDGVDKPALTLHKGWTYTFDVSDASNATHPFRFYAGSSQYSTNVTVTGTQGQAGAKVQIVIPESQPSNFQYYCTNHSGMGNTITVAEDPIKAVADIASSVVTVGGIAGNVTTVATNISNVNAAVSNQSNINAAVSNATNINAAVSNAANITAVANNETNINAVNNNSSNINAAVSNASNINAAVSNATNINSVVTNASNINTVAGAISNVNAVGNNISNVNSVHNNASNINSAVSNATNINTVSGSIGDVNRYANEYKISSSAPGSPSAGDLWFDTVNSTLKNYNGNAWLGITSNSGIQNVSDDTSPELAAALDCNNFNLTEVGTISGNNLQLDFGTL